MPAFLSATSVGLYTVGTNISWIIVVVAGSIAPIILPAATARREDGPQTIIKALHATFIVGTALAIAIAITAKTAIGLVYGHDFEAGTTALILLLPGCILYACSQIFWSGLNAANRPLTSAMTQVPGILITVVGLSLLLQKYGINAAAIVSSIAYTVVFLFSFIAYKRSHHLPLGDFFRFDRALAKSTLIHMHSLLPLADKRQ
jgi:O-antigen/teichoic acid export membrane protein